MPKRKRKKRGNTKLSRRLIYWLSHVLCAAMVILVFLTLIQCTIKKPEAPSWRTDLVIPLMNESWDMPALIEKIDQENLTVDEDGNPCFFYERVLDTVTVQGEFSVADVADTLSESLGVIQMDPFTGSYASVNLSDYVTLQLGVVPPISFDIVQALPPMSEFAMVTVESGFAVVTIVNDFGLDLDTVLVDINDLQLGGTVTSYSVPGGIPVGDTYVDTVDLAGKTISNQLEISLHCHTPGATGFSTADKTLTAIVAMPEGPRVSSATAKLPQVIRQFTEEMTVSSSHRLQSAAISGGEAVIYIQNNTNASATLVITLPDVTDGSAPFVVNQPIDSNFSGQFNYDLTGYFIEPVDQLMPQSLTIDVEANIDSSGSDLVTFTAGDQITVVTEIRNISFATIQGLIAPTSATFDNVQQELEIPKGFDQVQLTSAVMLLEIENSVDIPGSFSITIDGDGGQQKLISGAILAGTPLGPATTLIIDNNVSDFLNPVPGMLTVSGDATFGDGITVGSINADDYVAATVTIRSPLEMIVGDATFDGDWESTDLDQDFITRITDNINQAHLYLTTTNHLPLGIQAQILLSGDSATLYSDPQLVLGPISVARPPLTPDGGVESALASENVLTLDAEQAQVLTNDPLWIGQLYTLESTDGTPVTFSAEDSFAVSGYIEIDVNVSDDMWED